MNQTHELGGNSSAQNLQVWFCEHCQNVHFKTQNVMLDFSKNEFVELTDAMLEIYQNHFDPLEFKSRRAAEKADDILLSDTIA